MPKSMVPDLEWFDGNRMKFKDWWRGIYLFLKNNKVIATDDKITIVLAWLKKGIVGVYTQKKINQMEDKKDIQNWEEFIKEIKIAFSDKSKAADAK